MVVEVRGGERKARTGVTEVDGWSDKSRDRRDTNEEAREAREREKDI